MTQRRPFDLQGYIRAIQTNPCFICGMLAGDPAYRHHIVYEDEAHIAFLNKYPTLYGYTLVAPKAHREQVTGDFTPEEYAAIQQVIYRVAEALRQVVPTERVYILSLGSQQGNRHVHWHVAPLPPGVPFEEQQLEALGIKEGYLDLTDDEMASLAARLRDVLEAR
jgi:ATP adenylyltransferase